jgi:hypothetical protein
MIAVAAVWSFGIVSVKIRATGREIESRQSTGLQL